MPPELSVVLPSYLEEENLRLPAVRDRLKQSDAALWGGLFFIGGAVLQVVANWPT